VKIWQNKFNLISLAILIMVLLLPSVGVAALQKNAPAFEGGQPQTSINNDAECLTCHSNQAMSVKFGIQEQKETYSLFVNPDIYNTTVHKEVGLGCVGCHVGFKAEMGHGFNFNSVREATLKLSEACGRCHGDLNDAVMDGVHAKQLATGNVQAAVCSDCHSPHSITRIKDQQTGATNPATHYLISTTCQKCHSEIFAKYSQSVHGSASVADHNPDAPTCTDCHGVHNMEDPRSAEFRLRSPQICAKCHTDLNKMAKYGLSINVMNTYVSDFHGTTITIFEKVSPDAESNKPVCYDCHGIHDIAKSDDPSKGLQIKENLLKTCQKCHPDATANFPDSWTSHYIPDTEKYPTVYYINLFYQFLIPGVLGGMGLLVLLDFGRAMLDRLHKPKRKPTAHPKLSTKPTKTEEEQDGDGN
jgi:hypothetical protein